MLCLKKESLKLCCNSVNMKNQMREWTCRTKWEREREREFAEEEIRIACGHVLVQVYELCSFGGKHNSQPINDPRLQ
jgi:hypothetical protein